MAKSRARLRVQLISARGVFDAAQRLTRPDAAQTPDAELDDEPAPPEGEASDVGKERLVARPEIVVRIVPRRDGAAARPRTERVAVSRPVWARLPPSRPRPPGGARSRSRRRRHRSRGSRDP